MRKETNKDNRMEEDTDRRDPDRGRSPDRPPRRRRSRSASPRARRSEHTTRASRADGEWAFNPLNWCILHRAGCDICREYGSHFNDAGFLDDRSFLRCVEKRAERAEDKFREQLADARDEANCYRAKGMDLRNDLDRLQERYDKLECERDEHQCAPITTIAMPGPSDQATRVTMVPPPPAPAPVAGAAPPGYVPGQFASTIARHTRPRTAQTDTMSAAPRRLQYHLLSSRQNLQSGPLSLCLNKRAVKRPLLIPRRW